MQILYHTAGSSQLVDSLPQWSRHVLWYTEIQHAGAGTQQITAADATHVTTVAV
jgi:hypothetical protein